MTDRGKYCSYCNRYPAIQGHIVGCPKERMDRIDQLEQKVKQLQVWINDLQSGMYINCVYCGHRYGPDDEVPASMAQVLKDHVEVCPKHPMSRFKKALEEIADKWEHCLHAERLGEMDHYDGYDMCQIARRALGLEELHDKI